MDLKNGKKDLELNRKVEVEESEYEIEANQFMKDIGARMEFSYKGHGPHFTGEKESRARWDVEITHPGLRSAINLTFGNSIADSYAEHKEVVKKPSAYDILACLTKSDPGTYSDFLGCFGYEEDANSRIIYEKVREEWEQVEEFFSSEEIERLQEIN